MALITFEQLPGWKPARPCYGVVGSPIAHSKSPAMHAAAYAALGLDAEYHAFQIPPDQLAQGLDLLEAAGVRGVNLTVPHKQIVVPLLSSVSPEAKEIGAVNTVVFHGGGQRGGHNTDARGFACSVKEDLMLALRELRVMVLGAGGAARAVAFRAAREGCERLVLANRTPDKARALAAEIHSFYHSDKLLGQNDRLKAMAIDDRAMAAELDAVDLIVNCTTLGLKAGDPTPLPGTFLQPHHIILDSIYQPPRTPLMAAAQDAGARAINGLGWLLHQGALSFEYWWERPAPLQAMRAALA